MRFGDRRRTVSSRSSSARFKRLAVKAHLAEQISRSRLAELLDVNIADVDREVRRFGGEEAGHDVHFVMPR